MTGRMTCGGTGFGNIDTGGVWPRTEGRGKCSHKRLYFMILSKFAEFMRVQSDRIS